MKPSQFAKGFKARPDSTSSEKRTALDRLNAIDGIVDKEHARPLSVVGRSSTSAEETDDNASNNESADYRAWRLEHGYMPGQFIELPLKAIKASPFNPRHFYVKAS